MVVHLRGPILVGRDEVRAEAWVLGSQVTFARPAHLTSDVTTIEGFVLPGLVDAHCHIGLGEHGAVDRETSELQALAARDAGSLLLRDAGSPADTRWVQDRPDLPRLIRAGRHIARTRRYIRNYAHEVEPDELAAYVVQEAQAGDGWVKLVGDWIDRELGDLAPCWPRDALEEAIAAAHANGARVTAHCFSEDSLADLVESGIDCIEHATGLTEDLIPLFVGYGVAVVPTLVNIERFPQIAAEGQERYPRYAAHMLALHARRRETVAAARDAGVTVYVGTDAGGSISHGLVAQEVAQLVLCGFSADEALDAACWSARAWLGRPGLDEGAEADLVVYATDPRRDVAALAHPEVVMLGGRSF